MALPAGRYGVTKRQLNKIKNLPVNTIGMIEEVIETSEKYTDDAIGWDNTNLMPLVPYNINSSSGTIGESTFTDTSGHVSFIAPLKYKNTDYTLSNVGGNRFRIILSNDFPAVGGACNVIFSDLNARSHSFNSGNYNYVTFYCSYDGQSPDVIKPQLELGSIATAYVAHHASVDESKCDNSVIAPVEDQATCQNSDGYAVGKHFIRNSKFCTAITGIANGATFTLNTNYVEGTIADNLVKQETYSGTTNSYGNIKVTSNRILVAVKPSNSSHTALTVYDTNGDVYIQTRLANSLDAVANTAVSGTYYYI